MEANARSLTYIEGELNGLETAHIMFRKWFYYEQCNVEDKIHELEQLIEQKKKELQPKKGAK